MNNEVKVVLNENKVKMMTKMAIYEKNEGRKMLRTAKYFKGDFIAFGILKTLITTTFAFMAIYYIGMLVIFTVIAAVVYNVQYERSRKGLKKYFSRLNKLERFYNGQKNRK